MKYCPEENFDQLGDAITRIETYLGLKSSEDQYTISGRVNSLYYTGNAGQNLAPYLVVYRDPATGELYKGTRLISSQEESIIGITIDEFNEDEEATVKMIGTIENLSWTWTPNTYLYLDIDGNMTETKPLIGFAKRIAQTITSTKIYINIFDLITKIDGGSFL